MPLERNKSILDPSNQSDTTGGMIWIRVIWQWGRYLSDHSSNNSPAKIELFLDVKTIFAQEFSPSSWAIVDSIVWAVFSSESDKSAWTSSCDFESNSSNPSIIKGTFPCFIS